MTNHHDNDWLLGRRFVTDFVVVSIDDDPEVTVTLRRYGETYRISMEELLTAIDAGFIVEAGGRES